MKIEEHLTSVEDIMYHNLNNAASVRRLLEDWKKNNSHFFSRFGNKEIISTEIISLETDNDDEIAKGYREFRIEVENYLPEPQISYFLNFLNVSVGRHGFKNNKVRTSWDAKSFSAVRHNNRFDQGIKINQGMKFSRALRYFFDTKGVNKEFETEKLRELQDLYSTYRQTFSSRKSGKIFLSIHPLDYLSISDNNHNWTSCHHMSNGEYRIGNLNFMADGVTLVAYYASDGDFDEVLDIFPNYKWNSKRWRVLVHLENIDGKLNVIYNKQYPFESDVLIKKLDELILEIYEDAKPSTFLKYDSEELDTKRLYRECYDNCAYLDITHSSGCYSRLADEYLKESEHPMEAMTIGAAVYCVECGDNVTERPDSGMCNECVDEWYCEDCDGYYREGDMCWVEAEERYVCYDCFDAFHTECPKCGESCGTSNMLYTEMSTETVCQNCFDKMKSSEGVLIFSLNNMMKQVTENPKEYKNIKTIYEEVQKEEEELIKYHESKNRLVWLTSMYDSVSSDLFSSNTDMVALKNLQMDYVYKNSTRNVPFTSPWGSPFKRLEFLSSELPIIHSVIFLGAADRDLLDECLMELNISLEALGIKEEINLDYTKVRVI